jgi:hypothetical protein
VLPGLSAGDATSASSDGPVPWPAAKTEGGNPYGDSGAAARISGSMAREPADPVAVGGDEPSHPVGVEAGVLAQCPADRLAQEEVAVVEVGLDRGGQQVEVDAVLGAELADDRGAP